jgi:hypothetical protein
VADVVGHGEKNVIRVQVPASSVEASLKALKAVPSLKQVAAVPSAPGWLRAELNGSAGEGHAINNRILETLIRAEITVLSFEPQSGRLQDVFLHLTAEGIK